MRRLLYLLALVPSFCFGSGIYNPGGGGGSATPGGSPTQVQYNVDGSSLGGIPNSTVTVATNLLRLGTTTQFDASSVTISLSTMNFSGSWLKLSDLTSKDCLGTDSNGIVITGNCGGGSGVSGSTSAISISIDGGGSAIVAGSTRSIAIPFPCTISSFTVTADQSGSISVHISSSSFSDYPNLYNISGAGNSPSLSSTQKNAATVTGWSQTALTQGTIISAVVDSASTVTWVNIILWVIR